MFTRKLGRSAIEVSGLGLGCWAIGGPFWLDGDSVGCAQVDDQESVHAIERALQLGVTFFDTADMYGGGHSERLLGKVLAGRRDQVIIATKFGWVFEEEARKVSATATSAKYVSEACEASLSRLKTDYIDLYQFHVGSCELDKAVEVREALEKLVEKGKIRYYGWSTDDAERASLFAEGVHCTSVQQQLNILDGNYETLAVCEEMNLASVNRGPLARGLLCGKFTHDSKFPADDVRQRWDLRKGQQAEWLEKLELIREVLTSDGRSLAQAALGWLWARSENTVPIPGFTTVKQVEENAGAADLGPLKAEQMKQIDEVLGR